MRASKNLIAACAVGALLAATGTAGAAQMGLGTPTVMHSGNVSWVSGGVGRDSQAQMRGVARHYNLRMLFAEKPSGAFLADVHVKVENGRGRQVMSGVSQGPCLFAKLPHGRYRITAVVNGVKHSRLVDVRAAGTNTSFYWSPSRIHEQGRVGRNAQKIHSEHRDPGPRGCW